MTERVLLCWLGDEAPSDVKEFFRQGFPAMRSVRDNLELIENASYRVLSTFTLPREAWTRGFYDVLDPRAHELLEHEDEDVADFAASMLEEIEVFEMSGDSFGYVFFALQRA